MRGAGAEEELHMGGIALKNGLVLVSERHWAAAIREADGTISVASGQKVRLPGSGAEGRVRDAGRPAGGGKECAGGRGTALRGGVSGRGCGSGPAADVPRDRAAASRGMTGRTAAARGASGTALSGLVAAGVPLVRGLGRFGESLLVLALVKAKLPNAELPLEGGRVAAALAGSMAATSAVRAVTSKSAVAEEVGTALAAFIPAVLSLKDSSITGYHGAEHKVIGAREAALRAQAAADTAAAAKEHDRCGSNLVGPYLLATIATNLLARGRTGRKSPAASAAAGAASLGIAVEALRWANKNADSASARLLLAPGRAIQRRVTTTEPTPQQLEVAERALAELLRLEGAAE